MGKSFHKPNQYKSPNLYYIQRSKQCNKFYLLLTNITYLKSPFKITLWTFFSILIFETSEEIVLKISCYPLLLWRAWKITINGHDELKVS